MSSFKRKSSSSLAASSQSSELRLTSSGIASLDDILGGGIQLGTTTAILASDPHAAYNQLVLKYFIAEGLALKHHVYVISNTGRELVKTCMWVAKDDVDKLSRQEDEEEEEDHEQPSSTDVKIAWRYEGMKKFETTVPSSYSAASKGNDYCIPLDLASQIPPSVVNSSINAGYLTIDDEIGDSNAILRRLKDYLGSANRQGTSAPVRVVIPSLGDPWWGDMDPQGMVRVLIRIRLLLRTYPNACVMLTLPPYMSEERWSAEPGWLEKVSWTLDACITLNSFTADPSQSARLSSHHGLLHIMHMPRVNVLVPASERISTLRGMSVTTRTIRGNTLNMTGVGENNIAFKCTRRRLVFETFHLDVEGGVGERRTTPATLTEGTARTVDANAQSAKQVHHPVEVHVEDVIPEEHVHQIVRSPTAKKVRKKVGFQVNKPDLYDF